MEKRRSSRKVISLDARIISGGIIHSGVTLNLSEDGIYMVTATSKDVVDFTRKTKVRLQTQLPTKETIRMDCAVKWFQKKTSPDGMTFKMGMEVIDPPLIYKKFVKSQR